MFVYRLMLIRWSNFYEIYCYFFRKIKKVICRTK